MINRCRRIKKCVHSHSSVIKLPYRNVVPSSTHPTYVHPLGREGISAASDPVISARNRIVNDNERVVIGMIFWREVRTIIDPAI